MASLLMENQEISTKKSISDIVGMTISMVCAVQCALAPVILGFASAIPGWAHFGHGWIWISLIFLVAAFSIGKGYIKHRKHQVVYGAVIGFSFLLTGTLLEDQLTLLSESIIFVMGGLTLTWAHWQNYQLLAICKR